MSLETEIKAGSLERGRFRYFPVVPGRLEFSIALRRLLLPRSPQIVAVELPGFLETAYRRALARLPEMSVILYIGRTRTRTTARSTCRSSRPIRSPKRCARPKKSAREIMFLEPDSNERPHLPDTYPDTYAIRRIGLESLHRGLSRVAAGAHRGSLGARCRHGLEAARRGSRWRASWWWFR